MAATTAPKPLRVGVLLLPPVQLLDVSPVDLFGMLTPEYLSACNLPAPLIALGIPVSIHYISVTESKAQIAELTANAALRITATIHDSSIAPGKLDILLIPGPDPNLTPPKEMGVFIRGHFEKGVTVMSICTGIFPLAASGILKGKTATGPRALLGALGKKHPDVKWVEKRWARDGDVWFSGGITNGLDMVSAYLRLKYPGPLSDAVLAMADTGDRGQEYGNSNTRENLWWLGLIVRAWWSGGSGAKAVKS